MDEYGTFQGDRGQSVRLTPPLVAFVRVAMAAQRTIEQVMANGGTLTFTLANGRDPEVVGVANEPPPPAPTAKGKKAKDEPPAEA